MNINHLAEAKFSMTKEVQGVIPAGAVICGDPVLQYYELLAPGEEPKKIICANESEGLRTIYPIVNGKGGIENILDGGSQIVSMAKEDTERTGLTWDSSIMIHMQSANKQLDETCRLARNMPFSFGDLVIYLQVHIVNAPAYHVLMGRPFDCLTESIVENSKDGSQNLTITCPNTKRRVTVPTYARGMTPPEPNPCSEGFQVSMN